MKQKKLFLGIVILFAVAIGLFLFNQRSAEAMDYRMINVFSIAEGSVATETPIVPKEASISVDETTVIWFNRSQSDIQIVFLKGKTCKVSTSAALGWHLSEDCFITKETVPPGGTSSVVFNNKGRYAYEIQYVGQDKKATGAIIVW